VWDVTYRDCEDIDEAERFDDFISRCERGEAVMPAAKHQTSDEYIQCDGPYHSDGFVYYDDIPVENILIHAYTERLPPSKSWGAFFPQGKI
jgi:hypothetical protein